MKKPYNPKNHFKNLLLFFISFSFILISSTAFSQEINNAPKLESGKLKEILKNFEEYAEKGMKDWGTPGMAIAIISEDKVIYSKGFGVKKTGENDPVTEKTIFQIGSTSKAFTSTLVAMLVEEGYFDWNDRVIDHLPEFEMYDPWVTREFRIADLMAQHSGLAPYSGDFQAFIGYDRPHIIKSLRYLKPVSSFRAEYAYQNNLFLVAAALIEKYTGKSWEENVKERIFSPLGMNNSSVDMKSFQEEKNVATLHRTLKGEVVPLPKDWSYLQWVYTYGPAGGINSNVIDMSKWLMFQANRGEFDGKQLLEETMMDYLHSPKTITSSIAKEHSQYYCEAWIYRENSPYPIIWHNGGTSGCKTMVAVVPDAKLGIVVLSNYIDTGLPEALAFKFFDMYFDNPDRDWSCEMLAAKNKGIEEAKKNIPVPPESPAPPLSVENYTGDYSNDIYGKISIVEKDGKLTVVMGPDNIEFTLEHWDRDIFTGSITDLMEELIFVNFRINENNNAAEVVIDAINDDGGGVFYRIESEN